MRRYNRNTGPSRPVEPTLQTAHKPMLRSEVEKVYADDLVKSIARQREVIKARVDKLAAATTGREILSHARWSEDLFESAALLEVLEWKQAVIEKQGWDYLAKFNAELARDALNKAASISQSTSSLSNLGDRCEVAARAKLSGGSFYWSEAQSEDWLVRSPKTDEEAEVMRLAKQAEFDKEYAIKMTNYKILCEAYKAYKKTGTYVPPELLDTAPAPTA